MTSSQDLSEYFNSSDMSRKSSSLISLFAGLLAAASCGPSSYTMYADMRMPSESGLDLAGKSMSVAYLDKGDKLDSLFNANMSQGFTRKLEEYFFEGEEAIPVYSIAADASANYAGRDSLVMLIMETDVDVIFLLDSHKAKLHEVELHVYDSMRSEDEVLSLSGRVGSADRAEYAGELSAAKFKPQWATQSFTMYYYDTSVWETALEKACEMQWQQAVELWISCLDTKNLWKRACAEYNIALGCYMMGQYDLALEWLDSADADYKDLVLSPALRSRIISSRSKA